MYEIHIYEVVLEVWVTGRYIGSISGSDMYQIEYLWNRKIKFNELFPPLIKQKSLVN